MHRLILDLVSLGLVCEIPARQDGAQKGRPAVTYQLLDRAVLVAGVDIGNETTRFAIASASGRILASSRRRSESIRRRLVEGIADGVEALISGLGIGRDMLAGIGIGIAAVVNPQNGVLENPPKHRNWQGMSAGGIADILIAYPLVGAAKFARLAVVFNIAKVTLAADSEAVIGLYAAFAEAIGCNIPVLLEIDTGMHRAGVAPEHAVPLARAICRHKSLAFRGIMTHAGQTHDVTSQEDIEAVARHEVAIMGNVREDLERAAFTVPVVSAGSSITAPYFRGGDGITEIRPGTYIYNDLRTLSLFACAPNSLAVSALVTVVSMAGDRVTIDAGSKTLTVTRDQVFGYGALTEFPDARFTRLSEEHGVLNVPEAEENLRIGQRLNISPVHVCVWMDLQAEVYGTRREQIVERISVDAMRHSL